MDPERAKEISLSEVRFEQLMQPITVPEIIRNMRIKPIQTLCWAVGDETRDWYKATFNQKAIKDLRPKTWSNGSHDKNLYPKLFCWKIEGFVRRRQFEAERQLDMFRNTVWAHLLEEECLRLEMAPKRAKEISMEEVFFRQRMQPITVPQVIQALGLEPRASLCRTVEDDVTTWYTATFNQPPIKLTSDDTRFDTLYPELFRWNIEGYVRTSEFKEARQIDMFREQMDMFRQLFG